ncbi:WD40 repeat domain-containing protein [Flavobacterium sp. XS1P27]|uniref:WD40 repeat domain-containing protein n=1 Tax=Flavobacterium sp. XS1P27 TaxID=3401724 RepID=UPI003AAC8892
MKKTLVLFLLLFGVTQIQAQKKKTKTVKKAIISKVITAPQISPFAMLSTNNAFTINTVCVSPDGKQILSSGDDGTIRFWDIATRKEINNFPAEKVSSGVVYPVTGVAYSPDGKTFISGQKSSLPKLWDIALGKVMKRVSQKTAGIYSLAFSPNGILIALGTYGSISICDTNSSKEILIPISRTSPIISLEFSPDNQSLIAVADNQEISLWDTNSGTKIRNFDIHNYQKDVEYATDASFTPDGKTIITGGFNKEPYQGIIKMWNANDGTLIHTIIDGQSIDCLAISHDGLKLVTGNFDHSVKIWEISTGKLLKILVGHKNYVKSVCFSPDDQTVVASSTYGAINLWKTN